MQFSKKEIKDLVIAWLIISLAFAILFSGGISAFTSLNISFLSTFWISALTVGVGFIFHELMHKYLAQRYKLWAEFRASYKMLGLALLFSLAGFIIAAPGGVVSKGYLSTEKRGKVAIAGPLTNLALALSFAALLIFYQAGTLGRIFSFGWTINSLLALFNLLPIPGFDGRQVYLWNKKIYFISLISAGALFLLTFFI
jgi:Zn-dependent protease